MTGALTNGFLNGDHIVNAPDSPATPIDDSTIADIKIDVDAPAADSDLRHEPVSMKIDGIEQLRDASIVPELETPVDPASIPIAPPKGTPPPQTGDLLEEVKTAEAPAAVDGDVHMEDVPPAPATVNGDVHPSQEEVSPTATTGSATIPAVSSSTTAVDSLAASSPYSNNISPNDDDDKPPPAKRARKYSDAERASITNTATPPPATPSPVPVPNGPVSDLGPPTLSVAQWRFCTSTVRTLKKLKDAAPFLHPVDHVALNIPHYPTIIKHPMDFSTVDRKLASSNPTKPDPNPANPRYSNADEFVTDVRQIFFNCVTFNGPDHAITAMGKRVEAVFDKQIKHMPPPEEVKPVVVKKPSPPPPPPAAVKKPVRKPSTSVPVIRRSDSEIVGRPKREIHPPPPKDLPYADAPKKMRKTRVPKNGAIAEQLKFCDKVLKDLHKKTHYNIAHPFYEPVDWIKLDIPSYPKIIKRPMDLSTMRRKLVDGEYSSAEAFRDDFKLMIKNCYTFNPVGTPVNTAGRELERLFDEKWKNLPPLSQEMSEEEEEEEEELEDDQARKWSLVSIIFHECLPSLYSGIAELESQIENMNRALEGLKKSKVKEKKEKKKEKREKPPVPSTSKAAPKPSKAPAAKPGKKTGKKPVTDDDVLSFEQKKDLSDTIAKLDGAKLERVIQIIHEGVPEIRDSTEEIELEIDQLPASVLTKLYNFVIRPMRPPPAKRARTGKGTGTGGLKRKSMDEDVEAEKIRVLEERMALFEGGKPSAAASQRPPVRHEEYDQSSDSSTDGDSSGSDSE
ncbi:unnamed protein product [Somion occarium]|uniref:Bromodomain-containing protein n=1 Tax=Somion occarium TaxID=3059160 RepID=A0ABP1CR17_9APHY